MPNPKYVTRITLRDGREIRVGPLEPTDVEPLATFFLNLSEETKSCYGPHPFDRATAEQLCASIDEKVTIRFVAVLDDDSATPWAGRSRPGQIIGYMILTRDIGQGDRDRYGDRIRADDCPSLEGYASFAPVIADAYQDQGIGTRMARHVLACAKVMGLCRVILMGGVLARNPRAKHLYTRLGFREVGEFWTQGGKTLNYDMILEIRPKTLQLENSPASRISLGQGRHE